MKEFVSVISQKDFVPDGYSSVISSRCRPNSWILGSRMPIHIALRHPESQCYGHNANGSTTDKNICDKILTVIGDVA
jgi:hypothetical protein